MFEPVADVTCPYCGNLAELVTGGAVYGQHRIGAAVTHRYFWRCVPCSAYVGCHPNTKRALGTLADKPTRAARAEAHVAFDRQWVGRGPGARGAAYAWLAGQLDLPEDRCHIGMFSVDECKRVVEVCAASIPWDAWESA